MSHFFFDSSALVKRYITEAGTEWVRSVCAPTNGNTIIIAQITRVEIVSAVMRRSREGAHNKRAARAIRLLLDHHAQREYVVIGLTSAVVIRAQDMLDQYALRAYDAVQLASALEANERMTVSDLGAVIFVSADSRLMDAATASGLATHFPPSHD